MPTLCTFSYLQTNLTKIKIKFFRYYSSSKVAEVPSDLKIYLEKSQTLEFEKLFHIYLFFISAEAEAINKLEKTSY